jgi:ribose transport system substrate-binding protein
MSLMRKLVFLMIVVALSVSFVSVTGLATGKLIGISLLTKEQQFYKDMEEAMIAEAKKFGYTLNVVAGEFDPGRQARQVDDFIAKKADCIVLAPCDPVAVGSSIAVANKANIPVFTVDIANNSLQGKVISHIASDNIASGRVAGSLMAKALNGKGKVLIINHPDVTSMAMYDRVLGFRDGLAKYPDIKIIAEIPAWGQRSVATSVMEDMLQRIPDLAGVFGVNDDSALGALAAIEDAGKKGIMVVGYDASPEAKEAIKDGRIYGDVIQNPAKIGATAIQTINQYFSGKKVPAKVLVEAGPLIKDSK